MSLRLFVSEKNARNMPTNQGLPPLAARFNSHEGKSHKDSSVSTFDRSAGKHHRKRPVLKFKEFSQGRNVLPNLLRQRKNTRHESMSQIRHKVGTVSVKRRVMRPSASHTRGNNMMLALNNSSSSSEGSISNEIP